VTDFVNKRPAKLQRSFSLSQGVVPCHLYERAHGEKTQSEQLSVQVRLHDERVDMISYNCIELM